MTSFARAHVDSQRYLGGGIVNDVARVRDLVGDVPVLDRAIGSKDRIFAQAAAVVTALYFLAENAADTPAHK